MKVFASKATQGRLILIPCDFSFFFKNQANNSTRDYGSNELGSISTTDWTHNGSAFNWNNSRAGEYPDENIVVQDCGGAWKTFASASGYPSNITQTIRH